MFVRSRGTCEGFWLRTLIVATALLVTAGCAATRNARTTGNAVAARKAPGAKKPWSEATKGAEKLDGLFTLYRKPDAVLFEIRSEQMNRDFLWASTYAQGIGTTFMLGGLPLNDRVVYFERVGDRVLLRDRNIHFTAPAGSPYEQAKDLSLGNSVLEGLEIVSERDSGRSVLVDMTDVYVSDITDLSTRARSGLGNQPVRFDKSRSVLSRVKNFPMNTEVEARLTFTPQRRNNPSLYSVPDERYVPIAVHYSLAALPERPMAPRRADDRVGYFIEAIKDFSRDQSETFFLRYVDRWRLEKKDPAAALSEPVKPIVYYIDRTVPEAYRPWVKEGVEKWQKAFEAAGFKNAIITKIAPSETEDPDWDAEDMRYSTIRWITSAGNSFNAIGPSRVDPRTGEILDADVLVEAAAMQNYRTSWRKYAGPADLAADVLALPPAGAPLDRLCEDQASAALDGGLMRTALLLAGSMPPGSPIPDAYMKPYVVRLIMHEVGHTLGLRHNFRASTATPLDRLNDVAWTEQHGLMGSVMDYVTPNISADRSLQGEYFITSPGDYDLWAIRYGYTPSGATDPDADAAFARRIADESALPGHEYGTDEDAYAPNALDPRTDRWDLSDDPLGWAEQRAAYVRSLWRTPAFEDRIVGADGELPVLRRAMDTMFALYGRACLYAVKYVGGQYHARDHRGQPQAEIPLQPVPAEKQRQAMTFLASSVFAPGAFDVAPALLNRLAPDRWRHWGQPNAAAPNYRLDYDFSGRVEAVQGVILGGLLDPHLLSRLHEAEDRTPHPYTLADHMGRLTDAIWGEVGGAMTADLRALESPTTRRDLQLNYVGALARIVVDPAQGTPDDARALARLQLTRIDARAKATLALAGLGDYTRAHLMESRARIERALEAKRVAG